MIRSYALLLALSLGLVACGDAETPAPEVDTSADTTDDLDLGTTDTPTGPANPCCPLGTCPAGQSCFTGSCMPTLSAGTCYFNGQCPQGASCVGAETCACDEVGCTPAAGSCIYPEGCCNDVSDCGGGEICERGRCIAVSAAGDGCWTNAQCPSGLACEGATICACGDDACEDSPGFCAQPGVCCVDDRECGASGLCHEGRCVARPEHDACWVDGDCASGQGCLGASTCPCTPGAGDEGLCELPSTPGRCGDAGESCCARDSDCGSGEICVEGRACVPRPSTVDQTCYVDAHCGAGRVCEEATICGCSDDSCEASVAGTCRTQVLGCRADDECPTAMRCIIPDTAWCPDGEAPEDGLCVPLNEAGCWASSECNPNLRCGAEVVCTREEGCLQPNTPGICDTKVGIWDCCNSHLECGDNLECRNQNSSQTCPPNASAICVPIAIPGETCWNFEDCPQGQACHKTIICGCNARCRFNRIGQCELPTNCQTDIECGTEAVCARDAECILSPCASISTCPVGGTCQDKEPGLCWNHQGCNDDEYCQGLKVCTPDTTCAFPNSPGTCAPRGDLGECCSSYRGCLPGLRCISPGRGTGCLLDSTSVCVPATAPSGSCYADEDCDRSEYCAGEEVCPCGLEDCAGQPIRLGTCTPL